MSDSRPWAENPHSALALYGDALPAALLAPAAKPSQLARWPWWLNPFVCAALALILLYQMAIPTSWKRRCIYSPSCSRYAASTLRMYGFVKGVLRTWARLQRCNGALYCGGDDPPA